MTTTPDPHARRPPHRRRRLRRPLRRDQAPGGRRARLRRHREGLRRRRHLARQHLPRRRPATSRASSTPTPSPPTTGRAPTPRSRRSRPTSSRSPSESGTLDRFVFDTAVEDAAWDDDGPALDGADAGGRHLGLARTLIVGAGGLSEPKLPDIEGIETFQGELFHSARWDHDVDLTGKRVAVIGTGASAIQIVPELQKIAGHLDVYQRTAPWVIPRNDRPYSRARARGAAPRARAAAALPDRPLLGARGLRAGVHRRSPSSPRRPGRSRSANIAKGIKDPELREKVTPNFEFGCKRVLRSNTYYPALDADNTDLVTDPIAKVTGNAIVTADGVEREIDVLVVATGFYTTELPDHRAHRPAATARPWPSAGARPAWRPTRAPPSRASPTCSCWSAPTPARATPAWSSSSSRRSPTCATRSARLRDAGRRPASSRPRRPPTRWNRSLQQRMKRTVWTTGGCQSWYLDEHGRNTTLWPRSTVDFRRRLASFDADAYQRSPAERSPA